MAFANDVQRILLIALARVKRPRALTRFFFLEGTLHYKNVEANKNEKLNMPATNIAKPESKLRMSLHCFRCYILIFVFKSLRVLSPKRFSVRLR